MCHPGHISYNRSDRQVLKKSQGRPYETSSNIFCKSCKQIKAYISPKNIELYTIQAVMCHTGAILHNQTDQWALKKYQGPPYETSCNIFCNRSCSLVIILICSFSFWTKSHWSWLNLGLLFVLVISSCHWVNSATLLLREVPAVWQKAVYIGYDSMFFGDLKTLISLKLLQNMLKDVS